VPEQSASVPVCSTVLEVSPSRPTQKLEYAVPEEQFTVGSVQEAETLVKRLPVTAYPDQFELVDCVILWFGSYRSLVAAAPLEAATTATRTAAARPTTHNALRMN
jgi:hypothetical protein